MEEFIKWRRLKAVGDLTLGTRPGDCGIREQRMLSDTHVVYGVRYMVHKQPKYIYTTCIAYLMARECNWGRGIVDNSITTPS